METLLVLGCGKTKLDRRAPARELYTGSLFVGCRRFAEASGLRWGILSAKHGFVLPDQEIDPYDEVIARRKADRQVWGHQAVVQFAQALGVTARRLTTPSDALPETHRVVCLAGEQYADAFMNELWWVLGIHMDQPLRGKPVGERLAWLKRERERGAKPWAA